MDSCCSALLHSCNRFEDNSGGITTISFRTVANQLLGFLPAGVSTDLSRIVVAVVLVDSILETFFEREVIWLSSS